MKVQIIVALSLTALLSGCGGDEWDAFVYPGDDMFEYEVIRGFKTLDLCRDAATQRLAALRPDGGGNYECGNRCEVSNFEDLNVCEETSK